MLFDVLKGFLTGICASVPLGPIAIFVIQKSLSDGHRSGFLTGLGATTVDTIWATVAVFALALAERFIDSHRVFIYLAGGAVVLAVGASMLFRDPFRKVSPQTNPSYSVGDYLKAVATGFSNPGAIFVMFALLAFFGIELEPHDFRVAPVLLAVSAGSVTYWFFFSLLFSRLRKKVNLGALLWLNRIMGAMVMIIGFILMAEGLMRLLFP
ncbi:MAG: LysE family transporter [Bacteroidales bacterium]|nr:LysE family transporter [Bacteroidales bacterium]